jgi:signal transduction histidine kinase
MTAVLVAVTALVLRHLRDDADAMPLLLYYVAMGLIAGAFLAGGLLLVQGAIAPFRSLGARLSAVRDGRSQRVDGEFPSEVQPLVDDLNALLEDRERAIARALTTAGDLAHGLKTPLAVLAQEAEEAGAAGHDNLSATLRRQVERMQRQVDYQLARARATAVSSAAPGMRCPVLPSVEGLVRTMRRLHAERELKIESEVSPEHEIKGRREDLEEMLGNLLDNACQWARSRVAISSSMEETRLTMAVDDDGPGVDPSMRAQVLERGVRADQQVRGSGLGLAIVRELADLYGGSLTLETSPFGGTRARLELPRP